VSAKLTPQSCSAQRFAQARSRRCCIAHWP
jgi:hypothetical protein